MAFLRADRAARPALPASRARARGRRRIELRGAGGMPAAGQTDAPLPCRRGCATANPFDLSHAPAVERVCANT
eukprot:4753818-Alexandrium_andersonii.AAC.1